VTSWTDHEDDNIANILILASQKNTLLFYFNRFLNNETKKKQFQWFSIADCISERTPTSDF
jgi:hypothetical protein